MFRTIAMLICWATLTTAGAVAAAPFSHTWRIEELARVEADTVELRNDKGKLLKRVDAKQIIYLYSVMQAIEEVSELRSELLITDGEQPNAFATRGLAEAVPAGEGGADGGGNGEAATTGVSIGDEKAMAGKKTIEVNIIGINFAMLDLLGVDVHMAAALIGHELGHLKLNHGAENKKKRTSDLRTAAATRYSRDNEREADYLGAIWAVEAGYDPAGAVRLQELVYKRTKHLPGGFSGSHPSSIERIAKLKSLARRLSSP